MGEHFVLLVDRLITESTLEAVIESRNRSMMQATSSEIDTVKIDQSFQKIDFKNISSSPPGKLAECRICQDEDEDSNMETPCSCCGSLKYAHRGCVQRWCNEKGDTVCEICQQQFKPGYTAPPPLFQFGRIPMDFRGNWEIARRDSPQIIAMVSTDGEFLDPDYEASTARNVFCCRTVAFIFMILLILRHTLPLIIGGNEEYSLPLVMLLILRTFGIVLPIYVLAMAVTAIWRHRSRHHQHLSNTSETSSDEESETPILHPNEPQPLIIRVH